METNLELIRQEMQSANFPAREVILSHANGLLDTMLDYKELMLCYSSAVKLLQTKLEVLDGEFQLNYRRNPISSIHTRLKSQTSIMEKMSRLGVPISRENIEENLSDIAGVRVICPYIDDIYLIADALTAQEDVELVKRKDYIRDPKLNGYRSLHLIVRVPVYFAECVKQIRAEIQIRTIAMDFWASLEHQIKYKKNTPDAEQIVAQLRDCADVIAQTDEKMQSIRIQMDELRGEPNETEAIFEKLKKFDVSF